MHYLRTTPSNTGATPFQIMRVRAVIVALFFLTAPFTWSYVASFDGTLIRAVDVVGILLVATTLGCLRLSRQSGIVAISFLLLVILLLLRTAIYADFSSFLSAVKITYYFFVALSISCVIRNSSDEKLNNSIKIGLAFSFPLYALFLYQLYTVSHHFSLTGLFQSQFEFWNQRFR